MKQASQKITQKLALPIKTKIAAWWMIVIGIIFFIPFINFICYLLESFNYFSISDSEEIVFFFFSIVMFLLPGLLILLRRKAGWWIGRTFLWIGIISGIIFYLGIDFMVPTGGIGGIVEESIYAISHITMEKISYLIGPTLMLKGILIPFWIEGALIILIFFLIPLIFLESDKKEFLKLSNDDFLPLKTEIAAWLMGINSIIFFIFYLPWLPDYFDWGMPMFIFSIISVAVCLLLLRKKKTTWTLSIILLCILLILSVLLRLQESSEVIIPFFLMFPSLILLLLDRKNFWKIAK